MSVRKQRYNAQETIKKIWNDSGDEEDFDSDENKVESYELVREDKIGKPEDGSGTGGNMGAGSEGVNKQAIMKTLYAFCPDVHFNVQRRS